MKKQVLIFFARIPTSNLVGKTRIGRAIHDQDTANKLASALIQDSFETYLPTAADAYDFVYFHKGERGTFDQKNGYSDIIYMQQPQDSLAHSMRLIHSSLAQTYERVIIVGSDIPLLTKTMILECFEQLNNHEVVIGPVEDGGYGLIGSKGFVDVYSGIKNWESRTKDYHLFEETKNLLSRKNLSFYSLPMLFDVDSTEDLRKLYASITHDGKLKRKYVHLKHTAEWLHAYRHVYENFSDRPNVQ